MMPAGTYFIGDLCYVMHDEWNEFCNLTCDGPSVLDGEFTLSDGRKFVTQSTAYGDGCYSDSSGGKYPVDAGLIGCILLADIDLSNKENNTSLGRIYTFAEPFEIYYINGSIIIGNEIFIHTGDEETEDDYVSENDYNDDF